MSKGEEKYKKFLEDNIENVVKNLVWEFGHPQMSLQEAEAIVNNITNIFTSYKPAVNKTNT